MEKQKTLGHKATDLGEETDAVKAAAWAWYQHGSGYETKTLKEFNFTRTERTVKPSRYKMEAQNETGSSPKRTDSSSSLLDLYEVNSITRQLERLIERSHSFSFADRAHLYQENDFVTENGRAKKKKKNGRLNTFWMKRSWGICGTRIDAIARGNFIGRS